MSEKTKKNTPDITRPDEKEVSTNDLDEKINKKENDVTQTNNDMNNGNEDFTLSSETKQNNKPDESKPASDIIDNGDEPVASESVAKIDKQNLDGNGDSKIVGESENKSVGDEPADHKDNDKKDSCSNRSQDENDDDDDDEVIQGTPEELLRASKRQVAVSTCRLDDSDEPSSKIRRTDDDTLRADNKKDSNNQKIDTTTVPDPSPIVTSTDNDDKAKVPSSSSALLAEPSEETTDTVETKNGNCDGKMEVDEAAEKMECEGVADKPLKPADKVDEKKLNEDITELSDIPINSKEEEKRMSIEVVYDKSKEKPSKPRELVEINEEGEQIVLCSSPETSINMDTSLSFTKLPETKTSSHDVKSPPKSSAIPADNKQLTNGNDAKESTEHLADNESKTADPEQKRKTKTIEKEISFMVAVKTICQYDEESKNFTSKEIVSVTCKSKSAAANNSGGHDTSTKESTSSPGSLISNPGMNTLHPRLSLASSGSGSSGLSDNSAKAGNEFSSPRGFAKHAKKTNKKETENLWKDEIIITENILKYLDGELLRHDIVEEKNGDSSLPPIVEGKSVARTTAESAKDSGTPKSTNKGKSMRKTKLPKDEASNNSTPVRISARSTARNQTPSADGSSPLGKKFFVPWDRMYYPATVTRVMGREVNVKFYDNMTKVVKYDRLLPIELLRENTSVCVDYDSEREDASGILRSYVVQDNKETMCVVETDDAGTVTVPLHKISLTYDQAKIIMEESGGTFDSTSTPKVETLGQEVPGPGTKPRPTRGKSIRVNLIKKSASMEPSSSGVVAAKAEDSSDTDSKSCDTADEDGFGGLQKEIIEMAKNLSTKGPQSRMKGKARSKKQDDPKVVAEAGPIPEVGSELFKNMNFIIVCAAAETLDKFLDKENEKVWDDSYSDSTDHEAEWTKTPFLRDRLTAQLTAGGGTVYEEFEDIPRLEYDVTHMITNLPNSTAKGLLCLSVGIKGYSHRWVIRCCKENERVRITDEELPAGWSLQKQRYVEPYERINKTPFAHHVVVIPKTPRNAESIEVWIKLINNSGGAVRIVESPADEFQEATVVLTNSKCPEWVKEAAEKWKIPLLSTSWFKQCIIEGKIVDYDNQIVYQYDYKRIRSSK